MLKLNKKSDAYPWITMGIGTGLFLITGLVTFLILRSFEITSPFGSALLFYLISILISLIIFDGLILEKVQWIKMILISVLIAGSLALVTSIGFPVMMILYTMGGNFLTILLAPVLLYIFCLIPGLVFFAILYGKIELKKYLGSYIKASLPVFILFALILMGYSSLSLMSVFAGIGSGLGFSVGYKIKQDTLGY